MNVPNLRLLLLFILCLGILPTSLCVDGDAYSQSGNPSMLPLVTSLIYDQMSNVTSFFKPDISNYLGFCIKDVDAEWNAAFNFSDNLDFVTNCVKQIKGDVTKRLCTSAEVKLYFSSFFEAKSSAAQFLRPNKNCNLSSWVPGCEPGWCSTIPANVKVDIRNSKDIPDRTEDSLPCCEGFICPQGITCMIPCPLGSYCPRAKLNQSTGICDPYRYQLPPLSNHSCGGADMWADVTTTREIFCSAGSYCPTTTKKVSCSRGRYCQMGSTIQKRCFQLSNCKAGTADQDIHVYGVILIVALSLMLLIIYNFSDQVISTRYKRLAKSREAAARSARETAQARQRWRNAKEMAKKRALQISRSFSRKPSLKDSDQPNAPSPAPPPAPAPSTSTDKPSAAAAGKKKDSSNLTKMINSIDENPESNEGFNLHIGDKHIKKQAPKAKQLHSKSQIFKYAYGQLEKEKANEQKNKDMTFSGIISMATDEDVRTRPPIEVAFKNLTITLKGKKRHLMRCVYGKIMPGRVSAVMGPSGAGKTTFLSALAGMITGCTMSGSILINGKRESIHSYKKIIGYVPQDDTVHGNLTVEENLRFSARCRLASDLPKADKVLVVERVIESLGLQLIRDSLVGTVEKRGISGGQRKRVNVGLEMVMEPSLLILDEPTSGLDSSSSNLLLKALRREALEGVNICMVLHQPSYVLFKMFDDLILLAKGGFTVYHGSVKKVEEYFSGMGIDVPDRVTPPDHFIDILEGITKPGPGLTAQQLPVRWMLHNGYAVPPDMMDMCDEIAKSSAGKGQNTATAATTTGGQQAGGDTWQDVSLTADSHNENVDFEPLKAHDLSGRRTPGVLRQFRYFLGRVGKQRLREADMQAADYLILLIAGAALGTLAQVSDASFGALGYTYTVIAISLLCKIASLRSFTLDRLNYWRESASGMSSLAYFLSKDTIDHFNTIVKPLVYLSMYYFFNNTRSSFLDNYIVLVCLVYCVTGMAYMFAILLEPSPAQLWCVLLPVVLTLIANQDKDDQVSRLVGRYCYPKWAMEAFMLANVERYSGVWVITRCGALLKNGYDLNNWGNCLMCLILTGILCRFIAYVSLIAFQKKG
ncbi:putative white-brown complex homolog protein 30 [Impatiens glandulifera]|uniref:putative white-brown complex homolog protein 30 n=1 Tax=Impatiens glandulifera TaxID=253017 RepID=UPI001FB0F208|nr:putative white-brown complex homolog protein 30 [Impatiens glandulifera]